MSGSGRGTSGARKKSRWKKSGRGEFKRRW
jgi:hypothetical protein